MKNIELLKKLCTAVGVSGEEDAVRALILKEIEPLADRVEVTPLGNIVAFKQGEKRPVKKLMLCAHMDEVGLVVTNITEDGFLKFETVGGIRPAVLSGRAVCVNGAVPGVICAKPIHLLKGEEREKPVPVAQLSIDIGAKSRAEAEAAVQIGDNASFLPFFESSHGMVRAKSLDDRAGCFALIELMRAPLEFDTYFVFSVQEEIGMRGAGTAAYVVEPDAAIVLEGTTAGDVAGAEPVDAVCKLGGGPAVSFMDKRTIFSRAFFRRALALGAEHAIPCQPKTASAGGNDAGSIHVTKAGVQTVTLAVPCRYIHGPAAMASEDDIENTIRLTALLMAEIAGGRAG